MDDKPNTENNNIYATTLGFANYNKKKWIRRVIWRLLTFNDTLSQLSYVINEKLSILVAFIFGTMLLSLQEDLTEILIGKMITSAQAYSWLGCLLVLLIIGFLWNLYHGMNSILLYLGQSYKINRRDIFTYICCEIRKSKPELPIKDYEYSYDSDNEDPIQSIYVFINLTDNNKEIIHNQNGWINEHCPNNIALPQDKIFIKCFLYLFHWFRMPVSRTILLSKDNRV